MEEVVIWFWDFDELDAGFVFETTIYTVLLQEIPSSLTFRRWQLRLGLFDEISNQNILPSPSFWLVLLNLTHLWPVTASCLQDPVRLCNLPSIQTQPCHRRRRLLAAEFMEIWPSCSSRSVRRWTCLLAPGLAEGWRWLLSNLSTQRAWALCRPLSKPACPLSRLGFCSKINIILLSSCSFLNYESRGSRPLSRTALTCI